jgi:hypothetical protein
MEFEGPRRADKQVDVLSTSGALSQQSSTTINAPLEEEEHPRCQSTKIERLCQHPAWGKAPPCIQLSIFFPQLYLILYEFS